MSTIGVYVKPQPIGAGVITTDDVINQDLDFVPLYLNGMVKVQNDIVTDDKEMGAGPAYVKPVLPTLSTDLPAVTSVPEGANLTLTVAATGGKEPYKYQWFKSTLNDDAIGAVALNEQTEATLTISKVTKQVAGGYYAAVTDANGKVVNSKGTHVTVTTVESGS